MTCRRMLSLNGGPVLWLLSLQAVHGAAGGHLLGTFAVLCLLARIMRLICLCVAEFLLIALCQERADTDAQIEFSVYPLRCVTEWCIIALSSSSSSPSYAV